LCRITNEVYGDSLFFDGPEQNKKISVKESIEEEEEEEEEENIRYGLIIMLILFSASIALICYFYTYIHGLQG
jgi:hypothetical protein